MNIYASLLFLHGHITDPELARQLSEPAADAQAQGAGLASGSTRGLPSYQSRAPARCQLRLSPSSSMPAPSSPQRR